MVTEPSRCHLFGYIKQEDLLPLFLSYSKSHDARLFSDMSFKCRSSTSLASQPLWNPTIHHMASASEPPPQPLGLGIYTAHQSMPSLLHPRPSLSSIRSHSTIHHLPPPPTEPLPPLPAYIPQKYRQPTAMQKAVYPSRKLYGLHPQSSLNSINSIKIIPPTPILSRDNLATLNRNNNTSQNSLSSVYSRSISGDIPPHPRMLSETGRTASSSSTSTVKRSPLGAMRLAEDPESVVMPQQRASEFSDDDEDDDETAI